MLRTFSALTFPYLLFGVVSASAHQSDPCAAELTLAPGLSFNPTAISQTRMPEKNGWSIQWHKNAKGEQEILAVQQASLIVRRIDPVSGKILKEVKYLNGARNSGPSAIHSTPIGELVVARAHENRIELFGENGGLPVAASTKDAIKFLELVSVTNGDVFVVVGTGSELQILKRANARLEIVASVKSEAGLRQMFAFAGSNSDLEVALFDMDHKVQVFNYDTELENLETKPAIVQLGGKIRSSMVDGRLVFMALENTREGTKFRAFASGERPFSRTLYLPLIAGMGVIWGEKASSVLIPLQTADRLILRRIELATGNTIGDDLAIGDGRAIHDLTQFRLGSRVYYVFSKDGSHAYIQSENEVSMIAAPERSLIAQITPAVMLANGHPALGVLGYGPNGSVVNVISLTGAPQKTGAKIAPTATAE